MEELERIIEALKKGEAISDKDWEAVASNPYVYFGTDGNANMCQCKRTGV